MRYIGRIILLVLCLTLLLLTCCMINTVKPETAIADTEEPIIVDPEDPEMVYPQKWATGTGTASNPWANGCIESAAAACPTGGTIYLRAGYYQMADKIWMTRRINIIGEGIGNTIVLTAENHGFYLDTVSYVTIRGLTIDGDAQETDGETYRSCIAINDCTHLLIRDVETKNSARYGIDFDDGNYCVFQNIYSHDNYRHNLHPMANGRGWNMYNTYRDIYSWNSGSSGIDDVGSEDYPDEDCYNVYENIQSWDCGSYGIHISRQHNGIISNSSFSGNGGAGVFLYDVGDFNVNNCTMTDNTDGIIVRVGDNVNIDNCSTSLNEKNGMYIEAINNINITNVIVKNNNVSDTDRSGIYIEDCSDIAFTACQSYDDRGTPLQLYGIELYETNTGISLSNCKLSPNATGEIYNPNVAVLTVITEKREFTPSVIVRE